MKKLKDVLVKYNDQQIIKKLFEIYPDQKRSKTGYERMINQLRRIKPTQSDYLLITNNKYGMYGLKSGDKIDRKSTRLNSSHIPLSRMPSSA